MKIIKYVLGTIIFLTVVALVGLWAAPLGAGEFLMKHYVAVIILYIFAHVLIAFASDDKIKGAITLALCSSPFLDFMYFFAYLFTIKKNHSLELVITFIFSYIVYSLMLVINYKIKGKSAVLSSAKTICQIILWFIRIAILIFIIHSGIML